MAVGAPEAVHWPMQAGDDKFWQGICGTTGEHGQRRRKWRLDDTDPAAGYTPRGAVEGHAGRDPS